MLIKEQISLHSNSLLEDVEKLGYYFTGKDVEKCKEQEVDVKN